MGATIQPAKFAIAIRAETELAGATISGAMQKVITSVPMSPDESLANDLLAIFDSEFEPMIDAIRYCYAEFLPKMGGNWNDHTQQWFAREAEQVRSTHRIEVKLMAAEVTKGQKKDTETVVITIQNSQIGNLQTGKGATASGVSTQFNIYEPDVLAAVRDVYKRVEQADAISPTKRAEVREIALDAETELRKSQPNRTKLQGMLSILLATIKGVGTLADAYSKIEAALKAMGITIVS
jgi:hypothetical protein